MRSALRLAACLAAAFSSLLSIPYHKETSPARTPSCLCAHTPPHLRAAHVHTQACARTLAAQGDVLLRLGLCFLPSLLRPWHPLSRCCVDHSSYSYASIPWSINQLRLIHQCTVDHCRILMVHQNATRRPHQAAINLVSRG